MGGVKGMPLIYKTMFPEGTWSKRRRLLGILASIIGRVKLYLILTSLGSSIFMGGKKQYNF